MTVLYSAGSQLGLDLQSVQSLDTITQSSCEERHKKIVTTQTTTPTQPNLTTIEIGFEVIMLHHHPPTTTTETFRPVLGIVQG